MDMNDILNRWDKIQSEEKRKQKESGKNQVSHKKANAPTKEEKALAEEKDLLNVLLINRNSAIVMDSDKTSVYTPLRERAKLPFPALVCLRITCCDPQSWYHNASYVLEYISLNYEAFL